MKTCFRLTVEGDNRCKVFYRGKEVKQPYIIWFNKFNSHLIINALNDFYFNNDYEQYLSLCKKDAIAQIKDGEQWIFEGGDQYVELEPCNIPEETDFYEASPFAKDIIDPSIQEMKDFLATGCALLTK